MIVSVIVCSQGDARLHDALQSIAHQDYSSLDVVVIDATAQRTLTVPLLNWKAGHVLRVVRPRVGLAAPQAINAALDEIAGEYFAILNEADTYDESHVSAMVHASQQQRGHLAFYGSSRISDDSGQVTVMPAVAFNRALLFAMPLCAPSALFVNRRVLALGCRFDETLPGLEGRDFLAQIASKGDCVRVATTSTNCAVSRPATVNIADQIAAESRLRAKWAGPSLYHAKRASYGSQKAIAAYFRGDIAGARKLFETVLLDYPDDPNALHGLARLAFEEGDEHAAEPLARRAVEISPQVAEYRWTLANILRAAGNLGEARDQCQIATKDPALRDAANALLRELPVAPANYVVASVADGAGPASGTPPVGRLAPCPCGSGLRYKACHGRTGAPTAPLHGVAPVAVAAPPDTIDISPPNAVIFEAQRLLACGCADQALYQLSTLNVDSVNVASHCIMAGQICHDSGRHDIATQWFRRALVIDPGGEAGPKLNECCDRENAELFAASIYEKVGRLRQRLRHNGPPITTPDPTAHIIATLSDVGGSERHAANLYHVLAAHLPVQIWSDRPPAQTWADELPVQCIDVAQGRFPVTGTLVVIGQYFELGEWFQRSRFHRVVLRNNIEFPRQVMERVADYELAGVRLNLDFSYPSAHYRARVGLDGHIERALTNLSLFSRRSSPRAASARFTVGRHSRDVRDKHHPNDPAFFRRIAAAGHGVRLMGATAIAGALAYADAAPHVEVVPFASETAANFLSTLDCFLYRAHPDWYETGGNAVAEAMAMEIPVVVFAGRIGFAEVIEDGVDGFLVTTEAQAMDVISKLANSPELCARIGSAARAKLQRLAIEQNQRTVDFYRVPGTALPLTSGRFDQRPSPPSRPLDCPPELTDAHHTLK